MPKPTITALIVKYNQYSAKKNGFCPALLKKGPGLPPALFVSPTALAGVPTGQQQTQCTPRPGFAPHHLKKRPRLAIAPFSFPLLPWPVSPPANNKFNAPQGPVLPRTT
jgi:hypothetical protein